MATTVHIPEPLLAAVDRKARTLNVSRNRLIVNALEREIAQGSGWSSDFFARLSAPHPDVMKAAEEMLARIRRQRRSRRPVEL